MQAVVFETGYLVLLQIMIRTYRNPDHSFFGENAGKCNFTTIYNTKYTANILGLILTQSNLTRYTFFENIYSSKKNSI